MAGYDKGKAAASLGISRDELTKRAKAAGFSDTESYYKSIGGANAPLIDSIKKEIVALDRQLDELTPYLSLTDEEKQAFLDKAIAQITPYYDRKTKEIEESLAEGKLRTAEDILTQIRKIEEETAAQLSGFDLTKAETEEDFINTLSDITSTSAEDIATKRLDYKQRLENMKAEQIQSGMLTSGAGIKKRRELEEQRLMEEQNIQRQSTQKITEAEATKKYNLDQIQLARRAAEEARVRAIGGVSEAGLTKDEAMQTVGISDLSQLKSPEEMARLRAERGVSPLFNKNALTELGAEKIKAGEATSQELQADELARREQEYNLQRDKILAQRAAKQSQVSGLGYRSY